MFRLLLKYMLGLTLLAMVAAVSLYWLAGEIQERGAEQAMHIMYRGGFYSLQQQLMRYPQSQWPAVIKQLQPEYGIGAAVLPLSQIPVSQNQQRKLLAGEFLLIRGGDKYFFGYDVQDLFLYQRIANSAYVLKMQDLPIQVVAQYASAWMTHLIAFELAQTPQAQWQQKLNELQPFYGLPLTLIKISAVPENIRLALARSDYALSEPDKSGQINYLFVKTKDSNTIIKMGPIVYPVYVQNYWWILIVFFVLITIAFVIFLTYIFSRNLQKIYKITEKYSQADFSAVPALSRHSTLYTLYKNILQMGSKIQNLIKSQRNLTRFVAHECRTPVTTMLFAIDGLEQEQHLSEKARSYLDSIKADLAELNALVSDFLNYAKFSDQELTLNSRNVDINQWLSACVAKYKKAPKVVTLHADVAMTTSLTFDPDLMKHALLNLINNALKHARSQIQVLLQLQPSGCMIHVDDDGIAIEDTDKVHIFMPFVRLDTGDQGFGLGLTIAESIVKRHGGSLTVSDSPLGGSRFSLFIPFSSS